MQAGDLVKYRRDLPHVRAGVGILIKRTDWAAPWWSVRWGCGKTEIVNERNLKVINASR